jgi:integrase
MGNRIDIYGFDKKLDYYNKRIREEPEITLGNKQALLDFQNYCFSTGLSKARVFINTHKLFYLARMLGKNFKGASKEDLLGLVAKLEQNPKYKPWTKYTFKSVLKRFYRWLEGNDEAAPEKLKWLKANGRGTSNRLPEELLTMEDVRKLMDAAENPRDRALVAVLYESGCRIGELLGNRYFFLFLLNEAKL